MCPMLREPANALTHLLGCLLSVGALIALIWKGVLSGDSLALIGLTTYGLTQCALYAASTLFHGLRVSNAISNRLQNLDCTLVYALIAGTYTPVCLIALQQGWRWGLLGTVWGLAIGGLTLRMRWPHAPVWLTTTLYIAMGWVALAALPALVRAVPRAGIWWFLAGGIVYSAGAVIFRA